jgi:SanA protein
MKHIPRLVFIALAALVVGVVATNATIYLASRQYIYANVSEAPKAEIALVPGAAVSSEGVLSPIFIDRLDTAIALYSAGKVSKILVSGDNSTDVQNEVNPARLYLIQKGVPDSAIFLDHAGFNTYSTMYRARDIFGVSSILISTQSFHLPRAVFIARLLGIDARGVNADVGHILFRNYVREVFADEKAVLDLVFQTKPKYLGDPIPIGGDGRNYP